MSYGKMNQFIDIVYTENSKDKDGFPTQEEKVLANIRAYKENRHGTEKWVNMAKFSNATALFRFRKIPDFDVTTEMTIVWNGTRFGILSVENVRERNMYIEVLTEKVEGSK